jgi:Arc/MetJ-type ribon-helix-helix transcriptional regulator
MSSMKVPISARLDGELVAFLDGVRESRGLGSRSEALELAIRTLRDAALEADYAAAMNEWSAADAALWDRAVADGLDSDAPR